MKKLVIINGTNYASTGNIVLGIADEARKNGYDVYTCCKNSRENKKRIFFNQIYIGTRIERIISEQLAAISGNCGHYNIIGTYCFINKLKKIKPDIINLHVLHDSYINIKLLFNYIKRNNIPVVWTFHDPWAFTGKCVEFEVVDCYRWRAGCYECKCIHDYPVSYFVDKTKKMWNEKKLLFTSIKNLTIVTPSDWMNRYVSQSFFNKCDVLTINNGIDLEQFRYFENDFKKQVGLKNENLILGVANGWSKSKGLEVFIKLAKDLPKNIRIALVGTTDEIDKILPKNIVSIHKTYSIFELAKIYSAADLLVNPTKDDNFPTVNIEALACGTPVLTSKVGGCAEMIDDTCGDTFDPYDYDEIKRKIERIIKNNPYSRKMCIKKANMFNKVDRYNDYIKRFDKVLNVL